MIVTMEMMQYAISNHPEASPLMLETAAANYPDKDQSDYDCYCASLAEAVIDLAPTITVADSFGNDKQITRADFTKRWTDHIRELRSLQPSLSSKRITSIKKEISNAAAAEFDRIYLAQEHKGSLKAFRAIKWQDENAAQSFYIAACIDHTAKEALRLTECEYAQVIEAA